VSLPRYTVVGRGAAATVTVGPPRARGVKVPPTVSVVIPALNEGDYLGRLLDALDAQTEPPLEVIVADAGSSDDTADVARDRGAKVVRGGMPSVGRNAGARAATGDVLLFLDADTLPDREFLAEAMQEFQRQGFVVATALIASVEPGTSNEMAAEAVDLYLLVTEPFSPHAPGACIFVRREAHHAVGGFDETVVLAEDHDYVRRISKIGEFGVLTSVRIPVSMRRMDEERIIPLAINYAWSEMHVLAGKPVRTSPFAYAFGTHGAAAKAPARAPLVDVTALREQMGEIRDSFERVSDKGRERLDRLLEMALPDALRSRLTAMIEPPDAEVLLRYLRRRVKIARTGSGSLRKRWKDSRPGFEPGR
jgi:glycosyltransferase involved in cell wall biosynthesis